MPAAADDQALVAALARESLALGGGTEPERDCWRVVHRHVHGMLPSEYDIREIDEDLYVAVLARCRADSAGAAVDTTDAPP
jgi:hypothetical protein